jgi:hypothetical protein
MNKKIKINILNEQIKNLREQVKQIQNSMNTAIIVEPRNLEKLEIIINKFYDILGEKWNFVFYCGKGLSEMWRKKIDKNIEIRELNVNNLTACEYSDLFKSKEFWESLYGEYILTFQADTWILNQSPYDIDYFVELKKCFIGGNMLYNFPEMFERKIIPKYRNFNGGLSLRHKLSIIKIIDSYPPQLTVYKSHEHDRFMEDAYFVIGGYKLNMNMPDNEECSRFAIHNIFYDKCFGLHISRWTNYESDFDPVKFKKMVREKYPFIENDYL